MKKKSSLFRRDFDYEEDDHDRLKNLYRKNQNQHGFTNKATLKKYEFDYEEDIYEPEKNR
ncbi:hypothetical protein [Thermotalea metallivorans]|uniref:Uncharacterized protein n=1 Tax=Thermotalea metallivorans TaxID=520762 RepID=A0A140LDN7_9FIRM|nr:hypothetical protein [Thermotalea metallivorans]KXG78662.1 hypothetical protein AN619_01880 [Thermotalea metallivorans]